VLGNGAMVAAVRVATGVEPLAAGKPDPAMHRESVLRSGARDPIVVGDRLDTDIEGAARVGCPGLLVLTGVTDPAMLLAAPPGQRPTYVSEGLDGLLVPHPAPAPADGGWTCGGWAVRTSGGALVLAGEGTDHVDALRALCAAAWSADGPVGGSAGVTASGPAAAAAVARLGLADGAPVAGRRAAPAVTAHTG
jgi:hypothetical protein